MSNRRHNLGNLRVMRPKAALELRQPARKLLMAADDLTQLDRDAIQQTGTLLLSLIYDFDLGK